MRCKPHGDAAVVEGSYADDGRASKSFGGNLRPRPQLPDGIAWGGPGRCWRGNTFQGLNRHPDQIPRPPFDRIARIGRPAGAISEDFAVQGRLAASPQPTRWRNRAGHTCLPQAKGDVRPNSLTPNPSSQRKLGSQERKDRPHIPPSSLRPRRKPGEAIQARTSGTAHTRRPGSPRPPAFAGVLAMAIVLREPHRPQSPHRHPGLDPGSIQRLGTCLLVDAGTSPA